MVEERVANLQEVSKVLLDKYGGSFENVVKAAGGSAQTLLSIVVSDFPCFRDTAVLDSVTGTTIHTHIMMTTILLLLV